MVIELVLLSGALLAFPLAGLTNIPFLILLFIVVVLCLPVIRLVLLKAPPFVPTPHQSVQKMMKLGEVAKGDMVLDLGCGDGRIIKAAAEMGAQATGYELSVPTYLLAKWRTRNTKNATIKYLNFWTVDYSAADVVFCFLLMQSMEKFQKEIWPQLKPGARVVSFIFQLPGVEAAKREGEVIVYEKKRRVIGARRQGKSARKFEHRGRGC